MRSVPTGRRSLPNDLQTVLLQERFVSLLRSKPRYQHIVKQDFSSLWKTYVGKSGPFPVGSTTLFSELLRRYEDERWEAEDEVGEVDPHQAAYVEAVQGFVRDGLRATWQGEPAHWLMQAVHEDVRGVPMFPVFATFYSRASASLRVTVTPLEARWHLFNETGQVTPTVDACGDVQAAEDFGFAEWDVLRRVAHEQLDRMLELLRRSHDEHTAGYQIINRTALTDHIEFRLPQLLDWFWFGTSPDRSERDTLRRVAMTMRLNTPKARRKN